jgi:hypothetical protein
VSAYITQRAAALTERGFYTAEQAQNAVKLLNKSLEAFLQKILHMKPQVGRPLTL